MNSLQAAFEIARSRTHCHGRPFTTEEADALRELRFKIVHGAPVSSCASTLIPAMRSGTWSLGEPSFEFGTSSRNVRRPTAKTLSFRNNIDYSIL